ncbi:DUF6193 family natural product biosynthesis protein [Streptomyces sp. NPDC087850]|uniref:DUF6193 family natural product biosynthesis protein n=1 Tax=Streptomyces sp. NPDC087850 TaxID=3365809 RepID=UPI00380C331F
MSLRDGNSEVEDLIAAKWRLVLGMDDDLIDSKMVRAAYSHPRLRVLFPAVSHGSLQLSRCTRIPYTRDVPALFRRMGGGFTVLRMNVPLRTEHSIVGEPETLEEAIALIVANLPPGCGSAIEGTADDLA